jgi:hypothetical protein
MLRTLGSCFYNSPLKGALCLSWQWGRHAAASIVADNATPVLRELDLDVPKSVKELVPPFESRKPDVHSLRTGMVAVKVGMVSEWDEYGKLTPYTILWFDENQVFILQYL